MRFYPAYLDLRDVPCLVIGGGQVAERKAISLLEAGADVTVESPALTPKLQELAAAGKLMHLRRDFEERDLTGFFLVVAATDSPDVNRAAARLCRKRHILVNAASPPEESSFIVPSVVERGDLLIAVSTSGVSPALSRKIRYELEGKYGPEYELLLTKLSLLRRRMQEEVKDVDVRRGILTAVIESDVLDLLRQGKTHEVEHRIGEITGIKPR